MEWYEITYETGRVSVAQYADGAEATAALTEHHRRAVDGDPGGPLGQVAERIKIVRVYDRHPDDYNADQTLHKDVLTKELQALVKALADENGVVAIDQLAVEVRNLTHPMQPRDGNFGSVYRMKEVRELAPSVWGGA